ncbi:MAG TPA: tetratricopeptide repeat protein [Burkholderiaceae bacterium]|nr:tetratricopeptide repeat protein [Burkholderiaceae bacterium]
MRFADSLPRIAAAGALAALAAGCALLTGPEIPGGKQSGQANAAPDKTAAATPAVQETAKKGVPAPAAGNPAQKTAASQEATAQAEAAVPVESEVPLNPAVQRDFELGRRALIAGKLDDAERYFLALTKSNPELGGPHANLGLVYRQRQKLDESVAALERAVAANPKRPVYYNQLGIAYRMVGQFGKAREAYEKALALDPNYALACLNLGILYDVYLWDGQRALELYDRYLSLSPGGDDKVKKWTSDLRNRNQPRSLAARREQG